MTKSEIDNLDKVIEGLECCENCFCEYCKQEDASKFRWDCPANDRLVRVDSVQTLHLRVEIHSFVSSIFSAGDRPAR